MPYLGAKIRFFRFVMGLGSFHFWKEALESAIIIYRWISQKTIHLYHKGK